MICRECFLFYYNFRIGQKKSNVLGKISAQPHPTLCIQFLDREDNDKNKTSPLGKQICFAMVWGRAKILPSSTVLARYK